MRAAQAKVRRLSAVNRGLFGEYSRVIMLALNLVLVFAVMVMAMIMMALTAG
jgi:hypothetical protein